MERVKEGGNHMRLVPGVHQVEGVEANVYILEFPDHLTLVDTGLPSNAGRILSCIDGLGRKPSDIRNIVLTHCHVDHTGNVRALKRSTGARLLVHEKDAPFVAGREELPLPKGLDEATRKAMSSFQTEYTEPDVLLREGDAIDGLEVIHLPGHTPGSISLYSEERGILFAGDAIRFLDGRLQGPPEPFTPDMDLAIRSLRKLTGLEYDVLLSGHGTPLMPGASERVRVFCQALFQSGDNA
jgi:glyoxylase-like metal-dependent hydrolase (beta-lactamase superfamily II)